MKSHLKKVRLAIIGAGAITEGSYLPAAKLIPHLEITHIVDLDQVRAKQVAADFQVPMAISDYHELFGKIDGVVVATPPSSHARISMDFMNAAISVLCEKPIALTLAEAGEMVETGKTTHIHLAVAMNRRLSRSARILKQLVNDNLLGNITHFEAAEGYEYNWPLRTGHVFLNPNHRGIISDIGPHLFDLLLWLFNQSPARVKKCEDDNWGGIEANATVDLELENAGHTIYGQVEFSWTRMLHNSIRIYGENGMLEASIIGGPKVNYYPKGSADKGLSVQSTDDTPPIANSEFVQQLLNFTDSITQNQVKYVPAEQALAPMMLIEDCYKLRTINPQPWEEKWLKSFFRNNLNAK